MLLVSGATSHVLSGTMFQTVTRLTVALTEAPIYGNKSKYDISKSQLQSPHHTLIFVSPTTGTVRLSQDRLRRIYRREERSEIRFDPRYSYDIQV